METNESIGDSLRQTALSAGYVKLECGECTEQAWAVDPRQVGTLVEHALFGHHHRAAIIGVKHAEMLSAWQLGFLRGVPAQTEYEQRWRDEQRAMREAHRT